MATARPKGEHMIELGACIVSAMGLSAAAPPSEQATGGQESTVTPEPALRMFAIIYHPGAAWKPGRPLAAQGLAAHGAYMRSLAQQGILQSAGPLTTIEGGLVLLQTDSLATATRLMTNDPAVREGLFTGFVSEWNPVIDPKGWFTSPPSQGASDQAPQ